MTILAASVRLTCMLGESGLELRPTRNSLRPSVTSVTDSSIATGTEVGISYVLGRECSECININVRIR